MFSPKFSVIEFVVFGLVTTSYAKDQLTFVSYLFACVGIGVIGKICQMALSDK